MRELSLHILDIIENSSRADADLIKIMIIENINDNLLQVSIEDNGSGISPKKLAKITDPFITSRTTREVGLGLSLFKSAAESCEGDFKINSKLKQGTEVEADFQYDHIDRAPLGDIISTITNFIAVKGEEIDIVYIHKYNQKKFKLDTREIKTELAGLSIQSRQIVAWIRKYIKENLEKIRGGEAF